MLSITDLLRQHLQNVLPRLRFATITPENILVTVPPRGPAYALDTSGPVRVDAGASSETPRWTHTFIIIVHAAGPNTRWHISATIIELLGW
jgi:hypothetical protein